MKIVNTRPTQSVDSLFEDFVRLLQNGTYDNLAITLACVRLGTLQEFGLIIPRRFLKHITVPYELGEMEYGPAWDSEDARIYRDHDAVMIKSPAREQPTIQ